MGEHDLGALGTLALVAGLAVVYSRPGRPDAIAMVGIAAGGLAIALGASLASLLGLYLAAGALAALALVRRSLRKGALVWTLGAVVAVTAMTVTLRSGELGFLQEWFGPEAEQPGQYAASWSQRLIFAYVGGRVFLDNPVLGTGWHGELPEDEYIRFLPDARERFPDQPDRYFGDLEGTFIPQQTYDQVLIELGLVGGALFVADRVPRGAARAASRRSGRRRIPSASSTDTSRRAGSRAWPARSRARPCSGGRRSHRYSGSPSASSRRSRSSSSNPAHEPTPHRARHRAPERRRRGPARPPARARAGAARARRPRRRRDARDRGGVDGVRRAGARRQRLPAARAAAGDLARAPTGPRSAICGGS